MNHDFIIFALCVVVAAICFWIMARSGGSEKKVYVRLSSSGHYPARYVYVREVELKYLREIEQRYGYLWAATDPLDKKFVDEVVARSTLKAPFWTVILYQ